MIDEAVFVTFCGLDVFIRYVSIRNIAASYVYCDLQLFLPTFWGGVYSFH